jgi:hypothetical protein
MSVRKRSVQALERYLQATSGLRMMPDFLIVGTQRGGTTSLYRYLAEHPCMAPTLVSKGVGYFDTRYGRGSSWYRGHFPLLAYRSLHGAVARTPLLTGEGSPYYLFHPLAAERAAATVPDAKIIAMLRNPVTRAYSHYQHEVEGGFEDLGTFEEAIEAEPDRLAGESNRLVSDPSATSFAHRHHSYLARGHYADQLETWYRSFPREQVFVLRSEDLFGDPETAYGEVLGFLGLPSASLRNYKQYNAHGAPTGMKPETRIRLEDHFAEPGQRLADLLGQRFTWSFEG